MNAADDERRHLEGLDEATERERWEEFHAAKVTLTDEHIDQLGHWLSECLDDAAPLNERIWRSRAEWMVKGPTFQAVVESIVAARVAVALRDAADEYRSGNLPGDSLKCASVVEYLTDLADEYAPRADS